MSETRVLRGHSDLPSHLGSGKGVKKKKKEEDLSILVRQHWCQAGGHSLSTRNLAGGLALPLHVHGALPFTEENLHEVKGGEADAYGNGALDPVHAQPFVQASDESFFPNDVPHGVEDRPVGVAQRPGGLHPSTDHVQRVRG